jgi:outer membrane protein assembly factor BamA
MYPLISRNKYQAWLYSGIYFDKTTDDAGGPGDGGNGSNGLDLNGIRVGLLFSSEKEYYDSISVSDGFRLALSYSRDLEFLGGDYEINTAALEYKHYFSIFRPNVLALRLVAADSWGEKKRRFYMGGSTPYPGYGLAGDDLFELMRGYPSGFFSGSGGYLLNLEYRVALFKIEKALFLTRGLERVYLNLFTDIGNIWNHEKEIKPSFSVGAELSLALLIGDFRYVLSGGIAVGRNPHRDPVVYFRIGNSF